MSQNRQSSIHAPRYRKAVDILAKARMEAGITQLQLAEQLGLRQGDISKIEHYERRLDILEVNEIIHMINKDNNSALKLWFDIIQVLK